MYNRVLQTPILVAMHTHDKPCNVDTILYVAFFYVREVIELIFESNILIVQSDNTTCTTVHYPLHNYFIIIATICVLCFLICIILPSKTFVIYYERPPLNLTRPFKSHAVIIARLNSTY